MSAIKDLEYIMDDIETTLKANLQSFISTYNTNKGDSLLPNFDSDAYYPYRLPGQGILPPYPVFFTQYPSGPPEAQSQNQSVGLVYRVAIDACVKASALVSKEDEKKVLRYQQVLIRAIDQKITPNYPSSKIESCDQIFGTDVSGNMLGIAQVIVSIPIVI